MSNAKNPKCDLETRTAKFGENIIKLGLTRLVPILPYIKGEEANAWSFRKTH